MGSANALTGRFESLVQRLFDAYTRLIEEIEQRIEEDGPHVSDDIKNLNGLAKALETLLELSKKTEGVDEVHDVSRSRAELLKRIAQLTANRQTAASGSKPS